MTHENLQPRIKEILTDIFGFLEMEASLEISEGGNGKPVVSIKSTNDSLLVGYHGNTVNSLQYLLNIFLAKEFGESAAVVIDIGDYRKNREIKLREMARDAANKVKEINKSISLYPMSSYERRIVHEEVGMVGGVKSFSEGEGPSRKVIISLDDGTAVDVSTMVDPAE